MRFSSKHAVVLLVIGAFVFAGMVASPFIVQAYDQSKFRPAAEQRHFVPNEIAARIAEQYGTDKATILQYFNNGTSFRDLRRASFLAKAGGKSLSDVLAQKTDDNTWRDVAQQLNITREQMKTMRHTLTADRLNAKLGLDKAAAFNLLEQGYRPRDVAMSNLLAQNTGKSVDSVLSLKKINNTWRDVSTTLGVNEDTLKQDLQKMQQAFPKRHGPRQYRGI